MKLLNKLILCLLIVSSIFVVNSCTNDSDETTEIPTKIKESIRPYNPWVFRSVMDNRPRMITWAIDNDLYASYSTQNGSLYKVWKGDVLFEGAVYNAAHGPQPISFGDAYFVNKYDKPWKLMKNGDEVEFDFQYRGHRFTDADHAYMTYDFTVDGNSFQVTERPDVVNSDGNLVFERVFETMNMPDEVELVFITNASSVLLPENVETDGALKIVNQSTRTGTSGIEVHNIEGELTLNKNAKTRLVVKLTDKALIENPNNALISLEEMEDNEGKNLIGKNDCKSCHNTYVKTIGPSYNAIAEKYATSDDNVIYLVNKIRNGGSGIWGQVPMSAHPELSKEDSEVMVRYILSLDQEDETAEVKTDIALSDYMPALTDADESPIPGGLVKIYDIPKNTNKMPDFSTMKPKMGGVMAEFGNLGNAEFVGVDVFFGMTVEGYLSIEEDEEITFRMWSDDGSKLYIDDELVVDNDGNHGTEYKEKNVGLMKGMHKFLIEYYQGVGGSFLSFNWKPKSAEAWAVVPSSVISHDADSHSTIKGLVLPMSALTQIPGDGRAVMGAHPSFAINSLRPETFLPKVGGLDVLEDGRVILSTWDPEGAVYIVDHQNAEKPEDITYKKIAAGLAEPLGLQVVGDDIYVMQKQEMTQLIDHDGDEIIDEYRVLTNDWKVSANFHEFGFGLAEKDDYLYATLAIGIMPGGASAKNQPSDRGKAIKVNRKTGELEFLAHGFRTPNGVGVGYNDDIFVADNQGDWLPASKILHVTKDAFFNSRAVDFVGTKNLEVKDPVVWLPQDEVGNSPSTPLKLNVGPYKNQMIHGEVTHGGLKRVFVEEVEGELQGALFRFTQGFEAGVNRIAWADDETLIVGGIGNPGNWQQTGTNWYGLQSFEYTGDPVFEMLAVRAKTNGIEIEFTQALDLDDGWDPTSYSVQQYYYKPTAEYGGPKLDLRSLKVVSANVSDDRKRVFLELDGMKEGHVLHLTLLDHFVSSKNQGLWSTESWYTMNKIPQNNLGAVKEAPSKTGDNTLSNAEKAAGWKLLFNGENTDGIRNYKKQTLGSSWKAEDGILFLDSQKKDDGGWQAADGGDIIITDKAYEDFELKLEWKISNCGNSGIIYNVVESDEHDYVWQTGPEMQILDNTCHPDTKYPTHRAGDLYDMIETKYVTVKPAGEWNQIRLVSNNGVIEHWQNGHMVVRYDNKSDEWVEMIKNSKFKDMPAFGKSSSGFVSLQDHGDPVFFKNIKIREL